MVQRVGGESKSPCLPARSLFLLADSRSLFDHGVLQAISGALRRDERREDLCAAYVGVANDDRPEYYAIFLSAMRALGIDRCCAVSSEYHHRDRECLRAADLVLLGGGDPVRGWQIMSGTGMHADLLRSASEDVVLIGVSAGAAHLGRAAPADRSTSGARAGGALGLAPWIIEPHGEHADWPELRRTAPVMPPGTRLLGIPSGSGVRLEPTGAVEPIGGWVVEMTFEAGEYVETLLAPSD